MKKLIVFKLNGQVKKVEAMAVIEGIEVLFEGPIGSAVPDDINLLLQQSENLKLKSIEVDAKYNEMVKDIYDQMETVFGTRNDVSASAFAATFEAMIKRPLSYVDAALGFADEAAVLAYAQPRLAASDAYGVFRLKRIGQFQAEKAAIEGA